MRRTAKLRLCLIPALVAGLLFSLAPVTAADHTARISFDVTSSPLALSVSAPQTAVIGRPVTVRTEVTNTGTVTLAEGRLSLYTDPMAGLGRTFTRQLGTLAPGATRRVLWRVRFRSTGQFALTVTAKARQGTDRIHLNGARRQIVILAGRPTLTTWLKRLVF